MEINTNSSVPSCVRTRLPVCGVIALLFLSTSLHASTSLPFCTSPWESGDLCLEPKSFHRDLFPTSSSLSSSSSQPSSSSVAQSSSSFIPFETEPEVWINERVVSKRCDLTMVKDSGACIYPDQLDGSRLKLPSTVTRLSKEAFRLCSFDDYGEPSAIVYILDRSGSMEWNDPNSIAHEAFQNAISLQADLDSLSYAGYIPFTSSISTADQQSMVQLGAAGLTTILSKLTPRIGGGTAFVSPLKQAALWLNNSRFDGYRKAIIFLSDGLPTSEIRNCSGIECMEPSYDLIEAGQFLDGGNTIPIPVVHTIFLGDTASSDSTKSEEAKKGRGFMDYLGWRTTDPEGKEGSFHLISKAEEMEAIVRELVSEFVQGGMPVDFALLNETIGETVRVSPGNIRKQSDGTYAVILDDNLTLIPGVNTLELRARYDGEQTGSADPMRFQIEITDMILNVDVRMEGVPFQTVCYDITGMRILDCDHKQKLYLQRRDSVAYAEFITPSHPSGDLDTLHFDVTSEFKDTLRVIARKIETREHLLVYEAPIPIEWLRNPVRDRQLQLMSADSFRVVWRHLTDKNDTAHAVQRVLWEIAKPKQIVLFDHNHDGVMDSLVGYWPSQPDSIDLSRLTLSFDWPMANGTQKNLEFAPRDWRTLGGGKMSARPDSTLRLARFTGIPNSSQLNLQFQIDHGRARWIPLETFAPELLIDSMAPVITKAYITASQKERAFDTLRVFFSEPILSEKISESEYLRFWVFQNNQAGEFFKNEEIPHARWNSAIFSSFMRRDGDFYLNPGDSVRMVPGENRVQDLAGNPPWINNPYVYIDGERRRELQVIHIAKVDSDLPRADSNIVVTLLDGNEDPYEEYLREGRMGVIWGPIKVPKDPGDDIRQIFKWELWIYTNLGGYVAGQKGTIDCTHPDFRDRCQSEEGIKVFLEWDKRSHDGRLVGAGAYIMKGLYQGTPLLKQIGIRR